MNKLNTMIIATCIIGLLIGLISLMKIKPSNNLLDQANEKIFYLIRSEAYPSMEGGANILLDYSCDGMVQTQAVFETTEQRDAYIKHLETIGTVLNKGGIN
jgi:hypothetical protein